MKLINLIPLKEIDFPSQGAFDTYSKAHKLRPDTKVKIAGKTTTAGQAAKVKGTSVFGKDNTKNIFHKQDKPKDAVKHDFYNAGETLRQMGWKPDDIAKRMGDNLPYIDDENDIPQMQDSDDKEDWINLYKKSIAMKKAGYSSSEIADKLRANL